MLKRGFYSNYLMFHLKCAINKPMGSILSQIEEPPGIAERAGKKGTFISDTLYHPRALTRYSTGWRESSVV